MFNPFRKIWAFITKPFRRRKAENPIQQPQCEMRSTKPVENADVEPRSSVGQMLVKAYRATNEVAGAIMLPDTVHHAIPKVKVAWHKIGWAVAHPKLAAAKAYGWCASLWHTGAGWLANAAAFLATPSVIAGVAVVVVGVICIAAMMHGTPGG
jgi:hypothetical protein